MNEELFRRQTGSNFEGQALYVVNSTGNYNGWITKKNQVGKQQLIFLIIVSWVRR